MRLVAGTRLGHYQIVSYLGGGGMGEVYRAEDTLLGRHVAIKVLHENLAENPELLKRFQKEAKALATLSHPSILDLHDFGFDQGISFAVSELLEGETLKACILKSPLPWQKAVEIAAAVAEGLAAAHSKVVIHRDIKPENIFLVKHGGVKILDFGLARLQPTVSQQELTVAPTVSSVTQSGAVMGTVPYMSPEQVHGEPADERSDIFSFGCILYEMLAGKRPFSGRNASETTAAILRDDPPNLTGIPLELGRIVKHCLEKDPNRRLHSAHDLAFALKDLLANPSNNVEIAQLISHRRNAFWLKEVIIAVTIAVVALTAIGLRQKFIAHVPSEKIESLAVLPLQNLSGDPKQEYFADGMTEELIDKLARISALRVISRTSVMEYKGAQKKSLPEIAKELNVDAIVEGSVLQSGNRVRISAKLIYAPTDKHLWAENYERDMTDILALQNDVASAVAQEIRVKLTAGEQAQFGAASKVNASAYQAYLRGISYTMLPAPTNEELRLGIAMFERAIEIDPKFALGYAALSIAHSEMYQLAHDQTAERLQQAKRAVDRAFELQPDLPEAHSAMGFYHYWGFRNYEQALMEFSIAQKSLPNDVQLLTGFAAIYKRRANVQEAIQGFRRILELDPSNALAAYELGHIYRGVGEYAEAERYYDLTISLQPDSSVSYASKVRNHLAWTGDTKIARAWSMKIPSEEVRNDLLAYLEFLDHNYQAALDFFSLPSAKQNYQKALFAGDCYRQMKKPEPAQKSYDVARIELEKLLKNSAEERGLHINLSLAYAGLNRKQEAMREAQTALDLLPITKDAMVGIYSLDNLTRVYVMVGEYEAALDEIEHLFSMHFSGLVVSVPMLRIDPIWDPLRGHLRFQRILEKYGREKGT